MFDGYFLSISNVYLFVNLPLATEQVRNVRSTMFILDPFLHISCFLDLRCAFATPDGPSCQRVDEFTQKPPYKQANPERTSSSPPPCTQVLHLTIENKGLRLGATSS